MESKIVELIKKLYSKDGIERKMARYELVRIGKPAVKHLSNLLEAPNEYIRREAVKMLSQIADP